MEAFLANVEKVIGENNASDISDRITALEADISGLVSMKLHKEMDDEAYNRDYQRLNHELNDLRIKKDELDKAKLQKLKEKSPLNESCFR